MFKFVDGTESKENLYGKSMSMILELLRQSYSRKLLFMMTEHGSAGSVAHSSIVQNDDQM